MDNVMVLLRRLFLFLHLILEIAKRRKCTITMLREKSLPVLRVMRLKFEVYCLV